MGLLKSIFSRAPVQEFAKSLAADVGKRYPPALDSQQGKRPSANRLTRIMEDACKKAGDFRAEHQLGWMGKAKLANAFKWELQEMGYQRDFVEFATEAVVVHLSRGSK